MRCKKWCSSLVYHTQYNCMHLHAHVTQGNQVILVIRVVNLVTVYMWQVSNRISSLQPTILEAFLL